MRDLNDANLDNKRSWRLWKNLKVKGTMSPAFLLQDIAWVV